MTNDGASAIEAARDADGGSDTDAVHDPTSRWERHFCIAVFAVAVAVGVALVARGEPLPGIGPVLLLVVLVALSVNLGALFPSEFSATADVAILLAAVVGFAVDAPLLGPFVVGLLMGPFDWVHWKQRLFYRMAYNSGSQSLCILLAALAFRAMSPPIDHAAAVLAVAAAAAAIWMLGDIALVTLVLARRGGTSANRAARHVLVLDAITLPIALVGAAAGLVAFDIGWWAAALVLAPMPFVPDLVLVRARRGPVGRVLLALRLPLLVMTLVALGVATGAVDRTTLAALVVASALVGTEARPGAGELVAPILTTVVVAAAVLVDGRDAFAIAALVAIGGVSAALLDQLTARRRAARLPFWHGAGLPFWHGAGLPFWHGAGALALGAGAAVASVGVYDAFEQRASSPARAVVIAALAGIAFQLVVVAVGSRPCGPALERVVWSLPLVGVASALAVAWAELGSPWGAVVFGAVLGIAMGAVAAWASPPWTSAWLARRAEHTRGRQVAIAVGAVMAVVGAIVAVTVAGAGRHPSTLVMIVLATAQATVAMAAAAVRQWRFAPRRRARDAVVLAVAGFGLVAGYPALAIDGRVWSVVLLVGLLVPVLAVAWPLGTLADRAARRRGAQRMPESRSASA